MNRSHFWFDDLPPIKSYQYALIPHSFFKGEASSLLPLYPTDLPLPLSPSCPACLILFWSANKRHTELIGHACGN